ncbi:phage terminase large subunit family protein, partial [Gorillibacterium sp. sgz5001074]|uniref:phage terminase large subunit family protein n=1 Tax=Gorillibacterium sp. sgz5001074 TaxID=3446695 RepID=UPI003F675291
SKDRLQPMIRDTPALNGKVKDVKSRGSENTILHKKFPGGHITLVGANAPSTLASRPIRIVFCDEVDRYPASAGAEGDPVALAAKRTTTFWNRKLVLVSTPTVKGVSRIEKAYENSTKEQWCLPCPSCGELQPLTWGQTIFKADGPDQVQSVEHCCRECGALHGEYEWKAGIGQWIAREPERKTRGFHLNELVSPWKRWEEIVSDFLKAKDSPEELKTWVNTSLGETWEEQGEQVDENELVKRREQYAASVPDPVLVLTAGVDVQNDRFEVEVVGWGVGKESWGIEYRIIYGDPAKPEIWHQLDEYLGRTWRRADGSGITVSCTCIDSGGHHTTDVYRFCVKRETRRIFAIKGEGGDGKAFVGRVSRTARENCALFLIGVDGGKVTLLTRLKNKFEGTEGYCHFPIKAECGYGEEYFKGLTSEKQVIRFHKGRPRLEWIKVGKVRNEPLDVRNYATAALEILNPNLEMLAKVDRNSPKNTQSGQAQPRKYGVVNKGIQA